MTVINSWIIIFNKIQRINMMATYHEFLLDYL